MGPSGEPALNFDLARYLAAKKSVDDRALDRQVWDRFSAVLTLDRRAIPLSILEVGSGIGTMPERLLSEGLLGNSRYALLDSRPDLLAQARRRLAGPGPDLDSISGPALSPLQQACPGGEVHFEFLPQEIFHFASQSPPAGWDVLIASAFLDLIDLPTGLPQLLKLLRPGGFFYFPLTFDGETIFEPGLPGPVEAPIIAAYHRSMDERRVDGRPAGASRSGRDLLSQLAQSNMEILAAGASDWLVTPHKGRYPDDEAYFLHAILHFFEDSLASDPEITPDELSMWVEIRRRQIDSGELTFIARHLDVLGQVAA
jgi:SAM-dependent methyltransferase